jgi:hypothetical protein
VYVGDEKDVELVAREEPLAAVEDLVVGNPFGPRVLTMCSV